MVEVLEFLFEDVLRCVERLIIDAHTHTKIEYVFTYLFRLIFGNRSLHGCGMPLATDSKETAMHSAE